MKKRILALCLIVLMMFPMLVTPLTVLAEGNTKKVDAMFLHDTHSHLTNFATVEGIHSQNMGGFARIKTLINEQLAKNPDTLLLDAGDFSMGTLVQTVYEKEAAEIRMLGVLGMDVTTFGNHEFDYGADGMANMLQSAIASGDKLPHILLCNMDWDAMKAAGLTADQKALLEAYEAYGVRDYVVIEKGDVKIAVTGVMGKDSINCIPNLPVVFKDSVVAVQETIAKIKANEQVDMIVCVSHSGVAEDASKSEDEILAKEVPELDLIISGHTHTKLPEAIQVGETYVVSCAEYGKYLGSLSMSQKSNGRWQLDSYELIAVTEDIAEDAATKERVDYFMSLVDDQ